MTFEPSSNTKAIPLLTAPHTSSSMKCGAPAQRTPPTDVPEESAQSEDDRQAAASARTPEPCTAADSTPADELFATVGELIEHMDGPKTATNVSEEHRLISKKQAEVWLVRFAEGKIRELFKGAGVCKTEAEISEDLQVSVKPIRACLKHLVEEGVLDKLSRPVRYRSSDSIGLSSMSGINSG